MKSKIGFVASAFDLLHAGHCLYLKDAKEKCDHLVAAIHKDPSLERPEKNKPIQTLQERVIQLDACKYVDQIFFYSTEKELEKIIEKVKPDIRILGEDCLKRDWLTGGQYCGRIHYVSRSHGWSTAELRDRIKKCEV